MPIQYDQLGIALESHIKGYTPQGWREPIRSCFNSIPFIPPEKAEQLVQAFQSGKLEERLATDDDPSIVDFPAIRAAIDSFFEEGRYKNFTNQQEIDRNTRRLNLVVHKSMLEDDETNPPRIPGEYEEALRVLKAIRSLNRTEPEKTIYFEGFAFSEIPNLATGYTDIVLYGCTRESCLERSANELINAGFNVSYSIDGTAN